MKISEATYNQLNELLKKSFECNAIADNLAYNIGYLRYPNIEDIYHHSFAHAFPQFADEISPLMIELNARPVRIGFGDHKEEYRGNEALYDIFVDNDMMISDYRSEIKKTIETADLNGDDEIKIAMEELLLKVLPYVKQCDVWRNKADQYRNCPWEFDIHFEELTTFIEVVK